MEVSYNNKLVKNNEILKVINTQIEPQIKYYLNPNNYYTLIMYDPDAVMGTFIHWLIYNIKGNNIEDGKILLPYKGPAPPPNTGEHHYKFELYKQSGEKNIIFDKRNETIEHIKSMLNLNEPIYKIQFISKNENGGKKIKRRSRKRSKKNRRTKRKLIIN